MATLRGWFGDFTEVTGETPTHICLGWTQWAEPEYWPNIEVGVVLAFVEVPDAVMDHPFRDGYGGNQSPNLCAWSPSWVLFSDNYDGAESLQWVPRFPVAHDPIRPGGG